MIGMKRIGGHLDSSAERFSFVALLKACSLVKDLDKGTKLHADIEKRGLLEHSPHVASALVSMYAKCGALLKAQQLFDALSVPDVFSWSALIGGYARQGHSREALNCLEQMQQEGFTPNAITFISALKSCGHLGSIAEGKQIHYDVIRRGLLGDNIVLGTALLDMYAKCGALTKAQLVLDELSVRDAITWCALIVGYTQHEQGEKALHSYEQMRHEGIFPNTIVFALILRACGSIGAAYKGEQIHDEILCQSLVGKNIILDNALVDLYAKCGILVKAQQVLDELPVRDSISWNALILGYVQQEQDKEGLICFQHMISEGVTPDAVTYACMLRACGSIGAHDKGKAIHDEIMRQGLFQDNVVLGTALMDMYAKCGALCEAAQVFDELPIQSVVSWCTLIAGYLQQGWGSEAIECFERMQNDGLSPNAVAFCYILKACGSLGAIKIGKWVHDQIAIQGLLDKDVVLTSALVEMYAVCGAITKAQQLLDEISVHNVVAWTAVITRYAEEGLGKEAMEVFECMQHRGISPDTATLVLVLKACSIIGASEKGKHLCCELITQGLLGKDIVLDTAVLSMYAKCGELSIAYSVLDELPVRDVVLWNALIAGCTQQLLHEEALRNFERMQQEGLCPDAVTFTCVLSACSHAGLLAESERDLATMSNKYDINPGIEHHTSIIGLFGRLGHFDDAISILAKLYYCDSTIWAALLSLCSVCGNLKVGKWAFGHSLRADESDSAVLCVDGKFTGNC